VRADRLLSIMMLLRAHRILTAGQLAQRLEVSERTVLRDIDALSTAGVPVYSERGRHGGFALLEGFRADAAGLDDVEAQVLFAYLGLDTFGDLGLSRELTSALDKLAASAPARLEAPAARLREVVHVDRRRWFAGDEDISQLPTLRRAAVDRLRVRVRYASPREDRPRLRTLDPLGLVENGNRWYLVAYHRGTPRTYRLARFRSLTVLDEPARLPDGAVLREVWEQLRRGFEAVPGPPAAATLRLRTADEDELRGAMQTMLVSGTEARVVRRTPTTVDLAVEFRLRRSLLGLCLASAGAVEIVAPPELRAEAAAAARASLAALGDGSATGSSAAPR
jgi:predicted DNA-binding transcriptional regulator YafY